MSQSVLFVFRADGLAVQHSEFKNGWGSAPRVWTTLSEHYKAKLPPATKKEFVAALGWGELFEHWEQLPLEAWERDALMWTFDGFIVTREHFAGLARSLAAFDREHPTQGVSHLRAVGDALLRILETEPDVTAAAYWHTTVSDCQWRVYVDELGDYRSYDLNRDENHFIFEPAGTVDGPNERVEGTGT